MKIETMLQRFSYISLFKPPWLFFYYRARFEKPGE